MKKGQWQKALLALCTAGMILAAGCSQEKQGNQEKDKGEDSMNKATITMENGEKIHIQLDDEQAPITVENFVELVHPTAKTAWARCCRARSAQRWRDAPPARDNAPDSPLPCRPA